MPAQQFDDLLDEVGGHALDDAAHADRADGVLERAEDRHADAERTDIVLLLIERIPTLPDVGELRPEGGDVTDRKSVVSGKSVSVRVDIGGHRLFKKKNRISIKK